MAAWSINIILVKARLLIFLKLNEFSLYIVTPKIDSAFRKINVNAYYNSLHSYLIIGICCLASYISKHFGHDIA